MTAILEDEFEDIEVEPEPEVKTSRSGPARPRRRTTPARMPKRVTNIKDALAKQMFTMGTMMGLAMPVTGYYICQESDNFTEAVIRLAMKDSRYLDALENFTAIMPGVIIGKTVLGIGCAMGVDRWVRSDGERGIDPERRAAMLLGVTAAYWEVTHDGEDPAAPRTASPPPHSAFVPVA